MREQKVAVAIVRDPQGRFLVTFNLRWSGYALPMQDFDPDREIGATVAIAALENDLQRRLPKASATELDYIGTFGHSGRTGEETWYDYWMFEVDPGEPLALDKLKSDPRHPPLFLDPQAILDQVDIARADLTWSTPLLAREFLENQDVVLAIITRHGTTETQYLVVWNDNYQGYFFPAARIKTEHKPDQVAARLIRADLGYRGPVNATWAAEAADVHFTGRVLRDRKFRYQVCRVDLPDIDLQRPANPLELALASHGKRFRWVTADELADPKIGYSQTLGAVRPTVLGAVPPSPRREPLRRSEGGLALIRRTVNGETEWLMQWNPGWNALFFIGGHREPNESFRECTAREVREELGLKPGEFTVAPQPETALEYIAYSSRAGCDTGYRQELFAVTIASGALARVERQHDNAWLSAGEIRRLEARDARPISVTTLSLLSMSGAIRPV